MKSVSAESRVMNVKIIIVLCLGNLISAQFAGFRSTSDRLKDLRNGPSTSRSADLDEPDVLSALDKRTGRLYYKLMFQ